MTHNSVAKRPVYATIAIIIFTCLYVSVCMLSFIFILVQMVRLKKLFDNLGNVLFCCELDKKIDTYSIICLVSTVSVTSVLPA